MLKLVEIVKDYQMKDQEPVHALKGITVNFRRNEFVAVLGPSGCGKTTLLNIVGGLDRYTSGDLIIEGKSTKDYKDGDWDTYRNHSIGFVFQSYNLIPHQSIFRNVELALTIGGVNKEERKQRAYKALEKVGLAGLEKKKPNQLSGGQMQRVAIARALINEPEILLADEPTGALDSETSKQVMDLLKEVAKDCLVIMVTHNAELADTYANRIIRMKDGVLTSDSNPYSDEEEKVDYIKPQVVENNEPGIKEKKKSSMSFRTATALSVSNLFSKLKRTILVAIAGSIGIVGVSAVLAVSNGVHNYIDDMQDDMLSNYPLTISETSIDLTSLISGLSTWDQKVISEFDLSTEVGLDSMIDYMMTKYKDIFSVKNNDINDDLLAYIDQIDKNDLNSIAFNYNIDVTNNIFAEWNRGYDPGDGAAVSLNGITQMYISSLQTVEDFGQYAQFVNLFTNFMKPLPGDSDFILSQYDLIGNSEFATEPNELMVVVDENQTLTDILFAQMGFFTEKEFLDLAEKAIKENDGASEEELALYDDYPKAYTFEEVLGKKLYYVPDIYKFDTIKNHKITAVFDVSAVASMYEGFPNELEFNLIYNESGDLITGSVLGFPLVLIREGVKPAVDPWEGTWSGKLSFGNAHLDYAIVLAGGTATLKSNSEPYIGPIALPTAYTYEEEVINAYQYNGMITDIEHTPGVQEMTIKGILKKKDGVNFGSLGRGIYYTDKLSKQFIHDQKDKPIIASNEAGKEGVINYIQKQADKTFNAYVTFEYTSFAKGRDEKVKNVKGYANCINNSANSGLASYMSVAQTSNVDINRATLRSLSGLSSKKSDSLTNRYDIGEYPQTISIYPKDFASKRTINKHLDRWNEDTVIEVNGKQLKLEDRQELTYTDTVEMIIQVINTMIEVITIALIAFSSLALVVSCFMIAVITYISTMERVKEIGVIRSLGGRKKDVSRLFVAECLIIGFGSGVIGIGSTYLLSIIINIIVRHYAEGAITRIAALPIYTAGIMILLSIVLNVLSGLIPAMKASNQDPVIALRSE